MYELPKKKTEGVRIFLPGMGLFSQLSWEEPKLDIKSLKKSFWLIFTKIYHTQINIDQRYDIKYSFVYIWMWAVQFLMSLIEFMIVFAHDCLSQICHTILKQMDVTYLLYIYGLWGY